MIPRQSVAAAPPPPCDEEQDEPGGKQVTTIVIKPSSSSSLMEKLPESCDIGPPTKNDCLVEEEKGFMSMSRLQWATLIMLSLTTFADAVEASMISPFFPTEAEKKGVSSSEVGIIMGAYQLVTLIFSPIWGKYMAKIGTKRMFIAGLIIVGCTTVCLGFMRHWPSGRPFFVIALVVRSIEAIGDTASVTASLAILAERFPGMLATFIGLFETIGGIGGMVGPLLGGFLLQYGGFELPFVLMGSILIAGGVVSFWLVNEVKDASVDETKGMLAMMKIPMIWVLVYALIVCTVLLSFIDPTLSPHLKKLNLSPTAIGAVFLLSTGVYTVTAPVWGILIDKFHCTDLFIFAGAIACIPGVLLIGPSPLLGIPMHIVPISIGLCILALATGCLYIPVFQKCIDTVKKHGFEDNAQTYGGISGIYSAAAALGGFLGPTMGGICVDLIGFPWTTTGLGFGIAIFVISLFISYGAVNVHRKKVKSRQVTPEAV